MNSYSVLLRVRNEGPYLLEWIAHYRALGFDDILIVHNENDDGSTKMLDLLQDEGVCRHHAIPHYTDTDPPLTPGLRAARFIKEQKLLSDSRWLFTADADELLILKDKPTLAEFLQQGEDADQIVISWDLFLPDNETTEFTGDFEMRRRFVSVTDDYSQIKSFTRIDRFPGNIAPHRVLGRSNRTTLANVSVIGPEELKQRLAGERGDPEVVRFFAPGKEQASLYHYRFKSVAEFCMRRARGVAGPYVLKNNGLLFVNAMRNNAQRISKIDPVQGFPRVEAVRAIGDELQRIPGMEEVHSEIKQRYTDQARVIEQHSPTCEFIRRYLRAPEEFVASEVALELLEDDPESTEILWLAAFCCRNEDRIDQALSAAENALRMTQDPAPQQLDFVDNLKQRRTAAKSGKSGFIGRLFGLGQV